MASKNQVLILLLSLLTLSTTTIITPSDAAYCPATIPGGKMAVYWGQISESLEGSLNHACDSNLYDIVSIAYLRVHHDSYFLNLVDHCPLGDCTALASQIQNCQSKGIRVFLSLVIDAVADPDTLATYLYNNFLSGKRGPLGSVTLDGIDIAHEEQSTQNWVDLVKAINGSTEERRIYISGGPLCSSSSLDSAIETGLFDYLWISYYGQYQSCGYLGNGDYTKLLKSWAEWSSKPGLANTSVFLGLVASDSTAAASYGYIKPEDLNSLVLPEVTKSSNFGGVMLWNRYYDVQTHYSSNKINKDLFPTKHCACVCQASDSGLLAKAA